jgi:hypothetical protein
MRSNASATVSVRIVIIADTNASSQYRSLSGIANDCVILPICSQCKFPRRDGVWFVQREEKTQHDVVAFQAIAHVYLPHAQFLFYRREAAENIPASVQNQCQSVCVAFAMAVEFDDAEIVAIAPP